ncbi:hypothetical protein F8271_29030 [Micromonospora sp. ALFpr18c]|uniref:hypothetical protein n=1 Tax=unclassified Micromonospora TaxID=2617518 RepID=UPI00124B5346|nr:MULTISPECIES: hypothetical protein [unclassified Micromonospora]KAB1928562.1 hypothetical protein F8271_29030 [Micromonospora sp. ALFpr18c]MDG4761078.1 hypothetical protein [Micromonospora sp. WMMD710]
MVMVNQPAPRRHHRSRIAYALGLLALLAAVTTAVVLVRDPASSATRLTTPVPAPEITVVDADPPLDDDPGWIGAVAPSHHAAAADPTSSVAGAGAGGQSDGRQDLAEAGPTGDASTDVRRSLFWSGIFGLTISLAGLGLVGTRRRMW